MKRNFTIPLILALVAFAVGFVGDWVWLVNNDCTVSVAGFAADCHLPITNSTTGVRWFALPWFAGGIVGMTVLAITRWRKISSSLIAFARLADRRKYEIAFLLALYVYVRVSHYDSLLPNGAIFGKWTSSEPMHFRPSR
jgi:hypothetical protein